MRERDKAVGAIEPVVARSGPESTRHSLLLREKVAARQRSRMRGPRRLRRRSDKLLGLAKSVAQRLRGLRIGNLGPARGDGLGGPLALVEVDARRLADMDDGEDAPPAPRITREGASSLARKSTPGVTDYGDISSAAGGDRRPSVIAVRAVGARVLTRMLFFAPSRCSTFMSPIMAAFAAP